MNEKLRIWLAVIVAIGWLVNLLAPIVVHSYSTSLAANAPLLLILGALFQSGLWGSARIRRPNRDDVEQG